MNGYPNSDLATWQLVVMAVVAFAALMAWLTAVYLADRHPRWRNRGTPRSG
jgi:hypothetical protein